MREDRRHGQIGWLKPPGMEQIFDDAFRQLPRAIAGEMGADDGLDGGRCGMESGHGYLVGSNI